MTIVSILLAATALASASATPPATATRVLPTTFEAGHFYAVPETTGGQRLRLLVDTGGGGDFGMYWVTAAAAKRLRLKTDACVIDGEPRTTAQLPSYRPNRSLPPPLPGPCGQSMLVFPTYDADGQLGAGYLLGRVWTFDYPGRRLMLEDKAWRPDAAARRTPLGFPRDTVGQPANGFARIVIRVDGQPVDMLLDTGATAHPSPAGEKASGTPTVGGFGVASYITTSMLNRWHQAHPGWRVVENGDDLTAPKYLSRLIEVPKVEISGWTVGPVWFTERPDPNFHKFMSSMMDKQVEGAVGGNVFDHFVMTIDYPHSTAYFQCVTGCKAAATPPPVAL